MRVFALLFSAVLMTVASSSDSASVSGEPAPEPAPKLVPAAWSGTPFTLGAVKGNVVILAFWNVEVDC